MHIVGEESNVHMKVLKQDTLYKNLVTKLPLSIWHFYFKFKLPHPTDWMDIILKLQP